MFSLAAKVGPETTIHLICLKTGELLTASRVQVGVLEMLRGLIIIHFGQFEHLNHPELLVVVVVVVVVVVIIQF